MKKRVIIILVISGLVGIIMPWGTMPLSLSKLHNRCYVSVKLSDKDKAIISTSTKLQDIQGIIAQVVVFIADKLVFAVHNDIENGKANCVGYAQLCAEACNYAFEINGIDSEACPVVGSVVWFGIDLCDIAYDLAQKKYRNFVKDHDFVEIDLRNNKTIYIDPCLYDLVGNDVMTLK